MRLSQENSMKELLQESVVQLPRMKKVHRSFRVRSISITRISDLYLGVDARVMVEGNKAENVVMIPIEAINIGKDGSFVYVVTDGMVQKRMVTAGISSDEYTEIKKGLEVGEQVIISVDAGIEEGMAVNPVEG